MAVAAILTPIPTEYTMMTTASVKPTVATASFPNRPTKKMSTTAKSDSITISNIIGTESRKIPVLMLILVKSCSLPCKASLNNFHIDLLFKKDDFLDTEKFEIRKSYFNSQSEFFPVYYFKYYSVFSEQLNIHSTPNLSLQLP